jgi:hypothetical protein
VTGASKHWAVGLEIVALSTFGWIFDKIEDAAEVWANAAVSNYFVSRQLDYETRDLPRFLSFRIVFLVALFEVKG